MSFDTRLRTVPSDTLNSCAISVKGRRPSVCSDASIERSSLSIFPSCDFRNILGILQRISQIDKSFTILCHSLMLNYYCTEWNENTEMRVLVRLCGKQLPKCSFGVFSILDVEKRSSDLISH